MLRQSEASPERSRTGLDLSGLPNS